MLRAQLRLSMAGLPLIIVPSGMSPWGRTGRAMTTLLPTVQCPAYASLSGEDGVVADDSGTGESNFVAQRRMCSPTAQPCSDGRGCHFAVAADTRLSDTGAIDAGIGLNFHVVFEDGGLDE